MFPSFALALVQSLFLFLAPPMATTPSANPRPVVFAPLTAAGNAVWRVNSGVLVLDRWWVCGTSNPGGGAIQMQFVNAALEPVDGPNPSVSHRTFEPGLWTYGWATAGGFSGQAVRSMVLAGASKLQVAQDGVLVYLALPVAPPAGVLSISPHAVWGWNQGGIFLERLWVNGTSNPSGGQINVRFINDAGQVVPDTPTTGVGHRTDVNGSWHIGGEFSGGWGSSVVRNAKRNGATKLRAEQDGQTAEVLLP